MHTLSLEKRLVGALAALTLLPACGLFKPDLHLGPAFAAALASGSTGTYGAGSRKASSAEPWVEARAHVLDLADGLGRSAPDAIALHDAATWRRGDAVLHDDVHLLLDELARRGHAYEVASEVPVHPDAAWDARLEIRHLVLVRAGAGIEVVEAALGSYASDDDGWAAATLAGPAGLVTIVATRLDPEPAGTQVDELLDALAWSRGETIVACGLALEDPKVRALLDAGFEIAAESADHGLLLARRGAP